MDLRAEAVVRAPREAVFAFLADLENHWRLAQPFVQVLELSGPEGARDGGRVRIRGPLGVGRVARTRVEEVSAPERLRGRADVGATAAAVCWTLEPAGAHTHVTLAAEVVRATALDRMLLAAGGGWWLRRRFAATLARLDALL